MKHINLLIGQFPNSNASNCFSNKELKRLFYFAMPLRWRTNFINSGQSLHNSSIKTLKTYMVHQEHQTDAHRKKNKETNKQKGGNNNNNNSRKSNGGNRQNSRHNTSNSSNQNSNDSS